MSSGIAERVLPAFYEQMKAELTFPLAWGSSPETDFTAWRTAARAKVVESLLQHPGQGGDFSPQTLDEHPADRYTARTVELALSRYGRVRGSLLLPHGTGPFPGVLLLHDHGAEFRIGREKVVRPWADPVRLAQAREWSDAYYGGRFVGDDLAARGYAVLAVDALGWGDRGPLTYEDQQALAANFFQVGSSLAGLAAHEDIRAADFLASLPEVDGTRVGALGLSMGAYRAWQVSALSDTVRAAVAVCWMTGLREMLVPGNNTLRGQSAYHMLHPGLRRHLDIPDVASLAAPKPAMFHAGGKDALFTPEGVTAAYTKLRSVWESQGAGDRLVTAVWPEHGHAFAPPMQEAAHTWLDTWLDAGPR
ncbi:dienelactone hydrolase family protein [Streptomyces sp. NBC_01754]|uniref:dienelactone hydrolase family protein n=1 Tax=Streptomyces sp. NBC_01754 TaxID=2975930 RepID=UPI002DD96635|nr:dienelactone hydrolase family protein [Streptomyces sp. NBC_01754]WSC91856.1 dienelactone hydrolase family protein [Streptomyces sp. NBC_01754]